VVESYDDSSFIDAEFEEVVEWLIVIMF
jgi:hypothetical protein